MLIQGIHLGGAVVPEQARPGLQKPGPRLPPWLQQPCPEPPQGTHAKQSPRDTLVSETEWHCVPEKEVHDTPVPLKQSQIFAWVWQFPPR
jgi:hypothetical protein